MHVLAENAFRLCLSRASLAPARVCGHRADFPLIPAKGETWFPHTLQYQHGEIKEFAAQTELTWKYSNKIDEWKGGAQTMDGVMKDLFDGKKIPYIWKGEISVTQSLTAP